MFDRKERETIKRKRIEEKGISIEDSPAELQNAAKSSAHLYFIRIIGIALGLVRISLLGYYFGVERSIEAFFGATALLALSGKFLQTGAFSSVFVPIFLEFQAKHKEKTWRILSNLFNLVTLFGGALWLILLSTSHWIASWLVPGFDPTTQDLVVQLFRLISPTIPLSIVAVLSISVLHASRKFALPRWIGIITSFVEIGLFLLLVQRMGIYALAVGLLAGTVLESLLLLGSLYRMGYRHQWILNLRDPLIHDTYKMVRPFFLYMVAMQLVSFFTIRIISFLPAGSYAIYRYAFDLITKLSNFLNKPIGTVAYTFISEETIRLKYNVASKKLSMALKMTLLVSLAPTFIILLTSRQIIGLLLNRGNFNAEALIPLASALSIFGLGIFLKGAHELFAKTLVSIKRTFALNFFSILHQGITLLLIYLFVREWGLLGAVWASPLSMMIGIALHSGVLLYYRFPILQEITDWGFLKIALAASTAYIICFYINQTFLDGAFPLLKISILSLFFGLIYLMTCWFVRLKEFHLLFHKTVHQ
jgi:putative peptidoglycan lipid II flippase